MTVEFSDEQVALWNSLTTLQKNFIKQKLEGKTNVAAYFAAGGRAKDYKGATDSASVINKNKNVVDMLAVFDGITFSSLVMSRDEMAERLSVLARTSVDDVITFTTGDDELMNMQTGEVFTGQERWCLKAAKDMQNAGIMAIQEITATKDGLKIKMHDPKTAMKQLSELLSYDAPRQLEVKVERSLSDFYNDLTGNDDAGNT